MKKIMIAASFALLIAAPIASPAYASWAEGGQGNAVQTGSNGSLWHSEHGRQAYSYGGRRHGGWYGQGVYNDGYNTYGSGSYYR